MPLRLPQLISIATLIISFLTLPTNWTCTRKLVNLSSIFWAGGLTHSCLMSRLSSWQAAWPRKDFGRCDPRLLTPVSELISCRLNSDILFCYISVYSSAFQSIQTTLCVSAGWGCAADESMGTRLEGHWIQIPSCEGAVNDSPTIDNSY